jgi:hypothetical protein
MKTRGVYFILHAMAAGGMMLAAQTAQSQILYANTNSSQNGNFNYFTNEAGNEVVLAGPSSYDLMTNFVFQFDFIGPDGVSGAPTGGETAELRIYENDGPPVNPSGYATPGTVLFDSGPFGIGGFTTGTTATFDQAALNGGVIVPQDITWTVTFANLSRRETAGLALYSPATIGANYNDAWVKLNDTGWQLDVADFSDPPLDFAALAGGADEFITWNTPAPILYGTALDTNQLNATANVPGSFAYTVAGPSLAPINASLPISPPLNAGSYTLSAVFTPTDIVDYSAMTNSVTLVVSPAPLTVTASNATRLYGAANPVFTGAITGLQSGGGAVTAEYSCSANNLSAVGTYVVQPNLVANPGVLDNYTVSSTNGALTVTPAPLTVNAGSASRVYGATNPTFSGSIIGLLNGDSITAAYASAATPASGVGTYPIAPSSLVGDVTNYNVSTNLGTLTITAAPLTVTGDNISRAYNTANPPFSGVMTGLLNWDNITATFATAATAASPLGTYPIVPSLVDPYNLETNYSVNLVNGTLTVTLQITPNFGPGGGGTSVTILGTGFQQGATVSFGSSPAASVVVNNSTNITAVTPAASGAGWVDVQVTNPGEPGDLLSSGFAYANSYVAAVLSLEPAAYWRLDETNTLSPALNIGSLGTNANGVYVTAAQPDVAGVPDSGFGMDNLACQFNGTAGHIDIPGSSSNMDFTGPVTLIAWVKVPSPTVQSANGNTGEASLQPHILPPPITNMIVGSSEASWRLGLDRFSQPVFTDGGNSLEAIGSAINDGNWHQLAGVYNGENQYLYVDGQLVASIIAPTSISGNGAYDVWIGDAPDNEGKQVFNGTVDEVAVFTNALSAATIQGIYQASGDVPTALTPIVKWPAPMPIIYGQQVGYVQLDATAAVPGMFIYDPTLTAGTNTLLLNFVPNDNVDFSSQSSNVPITVLPAALTVTVNSVTNNYGTAIPAFTGSISGLVNGDNITATYSSPAVAGSGVGTYTITPTLVDPDGRLVNYNVTTNPGALTISAVPLTVAANNATNNYGAAIPVLTGSITGLVNGDNITATYSSPAVAGSGIGSYTITPALVDPDGRLGNYNVTTNSGALSITAVPLTVTANNAWRPYGVANPIFTGSISGLVNGDNITATYSCAATIASQSGAYTITPILADPGNRLGNYNVTTNLGALNIYLPSLTIQLSGTTVVLIWAGPDILQTAYDVNSPYTDVANATSPYTVTITGVRRQFFQLRHP